MDENQRWRLDNLSRREVDPVFLSELHSLTWPFTGELATDFERAMQGSGLRPALMDERAPRFHIEWFLQLQQLDSIRFAAANLGMTPESLVGLIPRLPELGLRRNYLPYPGVSLVDHSLADDLTRSLPAMRFKTFETYTSFCQSLHEALRTEIQFDVEPLYCATQAEMAGEENERPLIASTWDDLTMLPLSVKHQVWLDLGKPMSLPPDRCSKLFYARNREELHGRLAGRGEPRDIRVYLRFREARQNA